MPDKNNPPYSSKHFEDQRIETTLEELSADEKSGLSKEEISKKRNDYGFNFIEAEGHSPIFDLYYPEQGPVKAEAIS